MTINFRSITHSTRNLVAYSIVEVLIGTAVFGVGLVSLLGGIASTFSFTQLAREDLRATQLMLERMETIRLYNWNQINGSNNFVIPTSFTNSYYPPGLSSSSSGIYYTGQLAILPATPITDASYSNSMRSIQVTLQWTSGKVLRTRTMSTLVGSNGIQNYVYY
jgi:Tfp pilus assembly protein PilV